MISTPKTYASITAFIWSLTGTTTLIVHLRLLLRRHLHVFGTEDTLMGLSWACVLTTASLFQERLRQGFHPGVGTTYSPTAAYASATAEASLLYICGLLAKGSVALLLLRLIGHTSRVQRTAIVAVWALYVPATAFALVAAAVPPCDEALSPTQARLPGGACMSDGAAWIAFVQCWNFASAAIDVMYSAIATRVIAKLQLSRRRRAALIVALSLSYVTAVLATWRAVGAWVYDAEGRMALNLVAIALEANLVLICGSVVTLAPLVEFVRTGRIGVGRTERHSERQGRSGEGTMPVTVQVKTKTKRSKTVRTSADAWSDEAEMEMVVPGQVGWRSAEELLSPVEQYASIKDGHSRVESVTEIDITR